jgi:hypothetical protein
MSDEFKVIETQEDFDKAIQKRLAQKDREMSERYKDYLSPDDVEKIKSDYETKLAKINDDLKAANEKIAGNDQIVSDLKNRAVTAEGDLLKSRIAYESGVPYELAGRLVGSNEEELKADAEKLASFLVPKSAPPLHTSDSSNNGNADMASLLNQLNSQFMN